MKSSPNTPSTVILNETHGLKPEASDDLNASYRKDFGFIPIPHRLRYNPEKPFHFGIVLNIAFGLVSTFSESTDYNSKTQSTYLYHERLSRGKLILLPTSAEWVLFWMYLQKQCPDETIFGGSSRIFRVVQCIV
jgi:hypothetical protein